MDNDQAERRTSRLKRIVRGLAALLCVAILACKPDPYWRLRTVPTTEAERVKVAELETQILRSTPATLAGHDQDWDDAILAAHQTAVETVCAPTLWEYQPGHGRQEWTGQWVPLHPKQ
jgi:hypothetical protein